MDYKAVLAPVIAELRSARSGEGVLADLKKALLARDHVTAARQTARVVSLLRMAEMALEATAKHAEDLQAIDRECIEALAALGREAGADLEAIETRVNTPSPN